MWILLGGDLSFLILFTVLIAGHNAARKGLEMSEDKLSERDYVTVRYCYVE
jgi:hypothetical protein